MGLGWQLMPYMIDKYKHHKSLSARKIKDFACHLALMFFLDMVQNRNFNRPKQQTTEE